MNVTEMSPLTTGSLIRYVEVTVGLTVLTSWVAIALQQESSLLPEDKKIWKRALWPVFYAFSLISTAVKKGLKSPEHRPVSMTLKCVIVKEAHGEYDRI